ncbi:hypothetical protein [Lentibacillus amyloliquefaciens]|uniref:Uncharacterized protein n=1 Tax=Lentibacillus amyloliquefaciens TaxID=1472767 RepID=A0A0U4G596_9BACI|nr:hypothetical protein [Lentibacillus amyloliquefaciens]ALX47850.1 hypothetical protein AOX59_04075 [Lentibacillus amyloliquefaciens]
MELENTKNVKVEAEEQGYKIIGLMTGKDVADQQREGLRYQAILQSLQDTLDDESFKQLDEEDKNEYLHNLLSGNEDLIGYLSSPYYFQKHGNRKLSHFRSDEDIFCNRLSILATFLIKNMEDEEYPYAKDNQPSNMMNISPAYHASFFWWEVEKDVVYTDILDDYMAKSDENNLNEKQKQKNRKQEIIDNLHKYSDLETAYNDYKEMGMEYGFDMDDYTKSERKLIQDRWIEEFESRHIKNPKRHLSQLRKQYNHIGYELSSMLWQKQNATQSNKKSQPKFHVDYDELVDDLLDLSDSKHVAGMLNIMRNMQKKKYHPLYLDLKHKYRDEHDKFMLFIFEEFEQAIRHTDLDDVHRTIVNLILDNVKDYSIYQVELCEDILKQNGNEHLSQQKMVVNPYELIKQYVDSKYNYNKSRADIIRIINNTISQKIASTYQALQDDVNFTMCTSCEQYKPQIQDNFGKDSRNKTGFKSICKKCDKENQRKRLTS